jgi:hypothetical protein
LYQPAARPSADVDALSMPAWPVRSSNGTVFVQWESDELLVRSALGAAFSALALADEAKE